jgi:hypothetical protein
MFLLRALGARRHRFPWFRGPTEPLSDASTAALVALAEVFLRGGGCVSPCEWEWLEEVERAALAAAGDRIRAEEALMAGAAAAGPEGALRVGARIDGGAALERAVLEGVAAGVAARAEAEATPAGPAP